VPWLICSTLMAFTTTKDSIKNLPWILSRLSKMR
jgi:hypothetical protein